MRNKLNFFFQLVFFLIFGGLDSCKPKVVTAPTLPTSQDEDTDYAGQARSRTVLEVKISTALQGLIFSKSRVHGYGQLLGIAVEIIENMNLN